MLIINACNVDQLGIFAHSQGSYLMSRKLILFVDMLETFHRNCIQSVCYVRSSGQASVHLYLTRQSVSTREIPAILPSLDHAK